MGCRRIRNCANNKIIRVIVSPPPLALSQSSDILSVWTSRGAVVSSSSVKVSPLAEAPPSGQCVQNIQILPKLTISENET